MSEEKSIFLIVATVLVGTACVALGALSVIASVIVGYYGVNFAIGLFCLVVGILAYGVLIIILERDFDRFTANKEGE